MWDLIVKNGMPPTRLVRYCCRKLKEANGKGRVMITGVRKDESVNRKLNGGLVKIVGKPKTMRKKAKEMGVKYNETPKAGIILSHDNDENRRFVEYCYRTTKTAINPIVDWTDEDVWEFLSYYGCKSNPLYESGFKRIGCIGCPMAGRKGMIKEFERYPKYKAAYISAFERMIQARKEAGLSVEGWEDGQKVFDWWIGDR